MLSKVQNDKGEAGCRSPDLLQWQAWKAVRAQVAARVRVEVMT